VLEKFKPEWDIPVRRTISRAETLEGDTLVSARKIRQPIESKGDIDNAFDNISYGKGSAVLSMFESWVGAERFQKGVRRYLEAHAYDTATAEDFLTALEAEGGAGLAKAFSTFLDQPGVPALTLRLSCEAGHPPSLEFSQRRLLPRGSPPAPNQIWSIPVCMRYGGEGWSDRSCELVSASQARWTLSSARSCPAWVLGNAGESGYYGVLYERELLGRLLEGGASELALPERVGLLEDVAALATTGQISWAAALAIVPEFSGDGNPHVVSTAVRIAAGVEGNLVPDERRANYERLLRRFFAPRARQLGWNPKPSEDEETQLLRPQLVGFVARAGREPALRGEAKKLAAAWLEDPKAIGTDTLGRILGIAAEEGDHALFERFRAHAKKVTDRRDRTHLLGALGRFQDPAIEREALGILLTGEFDIRDSLVILWTSLGYRATRDVAWNFFRSNFDGLVAKLPQEMRAILPRVGRDFCDSAHRADVEAFFRERVGKIVGAQRPLAQTLEAIDQCIALKADQERAVSEFLSKH
jgi:alanyl aminopeptidase